MGRHNQAVVCCTDLVGLKTLAGAGPVLMAFHWHCPLLSASVMYLVISCMAVLQSGLIARYYHFVQGRKYGRAVSGCGQL